MPWKSCKKPTIKSASRCREAPPLKSPASTLIKICANTSVEDARLAERLGADYIGVIVEHPPSPRHLDLATALRIRAAVNVPLVAVTVNLPLARLFQIHTELRPAALQLHGDEPPDVVLQLNAEGITVWAVAAGTAETVQQRARELSEVGADAVLVDARQVTAQGTVYGGTGHISDWETARALVETGQRIVLAGGLEPGNVAEAVRTVRPWMVDVASGVEARKGIKDARKVQEFIDAVRAIS